MIIELILNLFKYPIKWLLGILPEVSFAIPDGIMNGLSLITNGIGYVLPLPQLIPLFTMLIALNTFKIIWAVMLRIKSFIPSISGG